MSLGLPVALQFIDGRMKNTKANAPITARPINIKTEKNALFTDSMSKKAGAGPPSTKAGFRR